MNYKCGSMASCVADIQERFARQNVETANQNAEIANRAVAKYIADEAAKAQLTQGATQATQGKYGASVEFPPNELPGYTA